MKVATDARAFTEHGFRAREFFAHEIVWFAKPYPDTMLKLDARGVPRARVEAGRCLQVNVYSSQLDGLPDELFTDRAVNWHGQHFGKRGLIAAAGLFVEHGSAFVTLLQSDLCQQIFRSPHLRRAASARLNNRFRYWYLVLFNAILDLARDLGLDAVYSPTAAHILATTAKPVSPELFVQIYDSVAHRYQCRKQTVGRAEYWVVPLMLNDERIAPLSEATEAGLTRRPRKVICVTHDVEEDVDTTVGKPECREALARMLAIERAHGVRTTYCILGTLLGEKAPVIAAHDDHAVAFHSFDHRVEDLSQLERVRRVDLQVKGYRPPQSVITAEVTDYALAYWNFEWLLSSARSLGSSEPHLEKGIVKIPVHLDDYPLHTGALTPAEWMRRLNALIAAHDFVAVGLHDCYARHWLDGYGQLLAQLERSGELWTCDQVAHRVLFENRLRPASLRPSNTQEAVAV